MVGLQFKEHKQTVHIFTTCYLLLQMVNEEFAFLQIWCEKSITQIMNFFCARKTEKWRRCWDCSKKTKWQTTSNWQIGMMLGIIEVWFQLNRIWRIAWNFLWTLWVKMFPQCDKNDERSQPTSSNNVGIYINESRLLLTFNIINAKNTEGKPINCKQKRFWAF